MEDYSYLPNESEGAEIVQPVEKTPEDNVREFIRYLTETIGETELYLADAEFYLDAWTKYKEYKIQVDQYKRLVEDRAE